MHSQTGHFTRSSDCCAGSSQHSVLNQAGIKCHIIYYAALFFFGTALQLIGSTCVGDRYQAFLSLKNHNS